jgi:N-acetylglucosamine malate deacetylase 1
MSIKQLIALSKHPRTFVDSLLTYPRFLGAIKPALLARGAANMDAQLACMSGGWWPAVLKYPVGQRILALSPHPDDETIGAGGLLIAHRGHADIGVITVFDGAGSGILQATEGADAGVTLVEARAHELRRACRHFGGTVVGNLDLPAGAEPITDQTVVRLRELTDLVKPDVVILPHFLDRHDEHRSANRLWAAACSDIRCMVLGAEIWSLGFVNAYFDITEQLSLKLAAIREFKTQLATVDYLSLAEGLAKVRGFHGALRDRRSGAAEAFFAMPNHEYCDLVRKLSVNVAENS